MSCRLSCDGDSTCAAEVTHLDEKGYVYCRAHGIQRRESGRRCRALRAWELRQLRAGKPLPSYEPKPELAAKVYRCAGPSCPGLPYPASEIAHPFSCARTPSDLEREEASREAVERAERGEVP